MSDDKKAVPMVCPECRELPESYYGILAFQGQELPACPNHVDPVTGEPRPAQLVAVDACEK